MVDSASPILDWMNVGLGLSFVLFNATISTLLELGVGRPLLTAAIRSILQLMMVVILLQAVFQSNNPLVVAAVTVSLNLLGAMEVVMMQSKRRHQHMFLSVFIGLLGSTIPISIIGTRYAMSIDPFWAPAHFIPILGMLSGSAVSGIMISVDYVLKELQENRDKIEVYLAFGATRLEACRSIVREALKMALMPVINKMSVIGIIAIPGMMTGAILGGSSVEQAAKLQMVIIFMLSSATTLASVLTAVVAVLVVVDGDHRVRDDRMCKGRHPFWIVWPEAAAGTIRVLLIKIHSFTTKFNVSVVSAEQLIPLTRRP